ncbi:MAG: DUF6882 domain-containing protein, partial [Myxococcota bacterium]
PFQATLLGSYSEGSTSGMWADANEQAPPTLTEGATQTREWLHGLRASEASVSKFACGVTNAWLLALSACDALSSNAAFRCPYEGGAAFVLVSEVPVVETTPVDVANLVAKFASIVDAPHRPYFGGSGGTVTLDASRGAVAVHFDESERIVRVSG